jgi:23S rRNA (cytosine1962-C5)-methyltransferase
MTIPLQPDTPMFISVLDPQQGYQLLDSGHGRKLEQFGKVMVDRPEPQAMWSPCQPALWKKADGVFAGEEEAEQGRWRLADEKLKSWPLSVMGVTAVCKFSAFRHLGIFPEQQPHWEWMTKRLKPGQRLLNLFGYTGVVSLVAGKAGAEVTHVDASKKAIEWAKLNQAESGLEQAKIRWILEDARKFVAREQRRGKTYHGILVDPPKFGRGPEGEVWDVFQHLPELLAGCREILEPDGFLILTSYAIRASFLAIDELMKEVFATRGGAFESGELAVREASEKGRLLSAANFVRWSGEK